MAETLRFICVIDDVFQLTGRGCVITPGYTSDLPRDLRVKIGDALRLKRPDGGEIDTVLRGIEMANLGDCMPLLLGANVTKSDIPIGTELWLVERGA